jgi:PAS domain S-box-containing protein
MALDASMRMSLPIPLDATEQALEEVFRHTPVGVVLTDLHGTVVDANVAFCSLLRRERDAIVGHGIGSFVHPTERSETEETLARLREQEIESAQFTRRYLAVDGDTITTRVTVSLVRSKDNEPICGIAFVENIGGRLLMEQALRDSEQRYRRVVEDQTELIVRCLPDGTRLFVNDAYCRYNSAPAAELIGTSFFPCIVEEEQDLVRAKFAALSPSNPVLTDSHRVFDPQGAVRWHEWTDRGFFDEHGTLIEIQSVGRDITEAKEAEELLRRSEESFRLLYGALPIPVWETDFSGVLREFQRRGIDTAAKLIALIDDDPANFLEFAKEAHFVRANRAALTLAGAGEVAGVQTWLRSAYTLDAARAYARSAANLLLGDDLVIDVELPLTRPDGARLDVLQRLAKVPNWPDEPRLIAIALDVTERRKAERELAHRRQILEEAEILAHIGSWEWDPATGQVYGSAGFWRIFDGSSASRFASVEETIACLHPDDRDFVRRTLDNMVEFGSDPDGEERDRRIVHPDGTMLIGHGVTFAEKNQAGETVRVYGVVQDLTEQRRAEEAAQRERDAMNRADKMISLGILVSGVAHEINNPNHAILLNTPLLREAWKGITPIVDEHAAGQTGLRVAGLPWSELRSEAASMIEDIEHASERVRGIVNELRGFALSQDSEEHHPLLINDVVHSSLRLLGNHIRKASNAFSMALVHDLPAVHGCARKLEQVIINLVLNACQSLESPAAMISIETGRTPSHVFLRVADGGRGIPKDELPLIKDPFFTTKRTEGGTGLGLAVSERIVQEHGGELTFDSTPGRGTVVTLSLPVRTQS